jgi:hypothetical protein
MAAMHLVVQHRMVQKGTARFTTWCRAAILLGHEASAAFSGYMFQAELAVFVLTY